MSNRNNVVIRDERELQNNDKALAGAAVASFIINFLLMFYGIFKDDVKLGFIALGQLAVMGIIVAIIKHRKNDITLPKTITGKQVSIEPTKKGLINRIAYCLLDGVFVVAGCLVFDIFIDRDTFSIKEAAIDSAFLFAIVVIIEFINVQYKVKKYNKLMAEYDDAE